MNRMTVVPEVWVYQGWKNKQSENGESPVKGFSPFQRYCTQPVFTIVESRGGFRHVQLDGLGFGARVSHLDKQETSQTGDRHRGDNDQNHSEMVALPFPSLVCVLAIITSASRSIMSSKIFPDREREISSRTSSSFAGCCCRRRWSASETPKTICKESTRNSSYGFFSKHTFIISILRVCESFL